MIDAIRKVLTARAGHPLRGGDPARAAGNESADAADYESGWVIPGIIARRSGTVAVSGICASAVLRSRRRQAGYEQRTDRSASN